MVLKDKLKLDLAGLNVIFVLFKDWIPDNVAENFQPMGNLPDCDLRIGVENSDLDFVASLGWCDVVES
jgi:hypothetical protein